MKVLATVRGFAVELICLVIKNWYAECIFNLWFQYVSCDGTLIAHETLKLPQQMLSWDQRLEDTL